MSEIWRGFYGVLQHADEDPNAEQKQRMKKIYESLNEEQKNLLNDMVAAMIDDESETESDKDEIEHADESSGKDPKDIYETLSDEQKELFDFMLGSAKGFIDELLSEDDEIQHSALMHYGVLGMKWGMRRYQNADGSLTEKGKKRYGEGGNYEYKSTYTKSYERGVKVLKNRIGSAKAKGKEDKVKKLTSRLKTAEQEAKASRYMDRKYQEYAKTTSTGKAIAQNLLFGASTRVYQQHRAMGDSRGKSAATAIAQNITGFLFGGFLAGGMQGIDRVAMVSYYSNKKNRK